MMPPIGRQAMVEGQFQDGLRLAGIVKGGDGRLEPLQVLQQQGFGRRGLAGRLRIGKKGVPVPLESHVRLAAGEVQVAEDFLQRFEDPALPVRLAARSALLSCRQ